jgi:hypothetical protein
LFALFLHPIRSFSLCRGYASGNAANKDQGAFAYIAMIPLVGLAYVALAKHLKFID